MTFKLLRRPTSIQPGHTGPTSMLARVACSRRVLLSNPTITTSCWQRVLSHNPPRTFSTSVKFTRANVPYQKPQARKVKTTRLAALTPEQFARNPENAPRPKREAAKRDKTGAVTEWRSPDAVDPLLAAQRVAQFLAKGNHESALSFAQSVSRRAKVVVSWNHLIDHALKSQRLREALKLYQEMKKRQQEPNQQTFTILFRGLAQSEHPKTAVVEGVKLYNTMLAKPDTEPNVIHLNAILKVCARAKDLEALFTVLESADGKSRLPDSRTYTAVLNALRAAAEDSRPPQHDGGPQAADQEAIQETLHRAKNVWSEVISRWRAGTLAIDETLVCSMGRILQLGDSEDKRSILKLVEETMAIRPTPSGHKAIDDATTNLEQGPDGAVVSDVKALIQSRPTSDKDSVGRPLQYAQPGRNSLSLLLESFADTGMTAPTAQCWDAFVQRWVVPDANNWYALLRSFSRAKNSTHAASYVSKMPQNLATKKHIRMAMRACLRDNLNQHAFSNANLVLKTMETHLGVPDTATLQLYLQIAYASRRHLDTKSVVTPQKIGYEHGRQISRALSNMQVPYDTLHKHIEELKLEEIKDNDEWLHQSAILADLVAVARKMIAAYDRVIFESMVPEKVADTLKPTRNNLNRFVVGYFEERVKRDPEFDKKSLDKEFNDFEEDIVDEEPRKQHPRAGRTAKSSYQRHVEAESSQHFEDQFAARLDSKNARGQTRFSHTPTIPPSPSSPQARPAKPTHTGPYPYERVLRRLPGKPLRQNIAANSPRRRALALQGTRPERRERMGLTDVYS